MTDVNIISTAQFALYAPDVDTSRYGDATVSGYISAASNMVKEYLGYTPFAEVIVDELVDGRVTTEGDLLIFPAKLPIISVTAIKISKGATDVSLTLQDGSGNDKFNINQTKRHIRFPYGEITLQGTPVFTDFYALRHSHFYVKITYRAGWEVSQLPQSIVQATILIMRDLLKNPYNQFGASRIQQGGISLEFSGRESRLLLDAKRLLAPFRRTI